MRARGTSESFYETLMSTSMSGRAGVASTTSGGTQRTCGANHVEMLLGRRSVREWGEKGVATRTLVDVVRAGDECSDRNFRADGHDGDEVVLLASVRRPDGIASGFYSVSGDGMKRMPTDMASDVTEGLYGSAPVELYFFIDLAEVLSGRARYESGLVAAGARAFSVWIHAGRADLVGCVYGRPCAGVTRAARAARHGLKHVVTLSLGYANAG